MGTLVSKNILRGFGESVYMFVCLQVLPMCVCRLEVAVMGLVQLLSMLFFETGFHCSQKILIQPDWVATKPQEFCLRLPSVGITGAWCCA